MRLESRYCYAIKKQWQTISKQFYYLKKRLYLKLQFYIISINIEDNCCSWDPISKNLLNHLWRQPMLYSSCEHCLHHNSHNSIDSQGIPLHIGICENSMALGLGWSRDELLLFSQMTWALEVKQQYVGKHYHKATHHWLSMPHFLFWIAQYNFLSAFFDELCGKK